MLLLASLFLQGWRPYCVGGPVVAFIHAVAWVPTVVSSHDIVSFMFLMVSGAGLSAIADVPSVTICVVDVSAVPFEHAVASGPAVMYYTIGLQYLTIAIGL